MTGRREKENTWCNHVTFNNLPEKYVQNRLASVRLCHCPNERLQGYLYVWQHHRYLIIVLTTPYLVCNRHQFSPKTQTFCQNKNIQRSQGLCTNNCFCRQHSQITTIPDQHEPQSVHCIWITTGPLQFAAMNKLFVSLPENICVGVAKMDHRSRG